MATRARRSTVEPTQRRAGAGLPPYEKPSFPLNPAAQRALQHLTQTHSLLKLDSDLSEAQGALCHTAGEINDRLYQKRVAAQKQQARREQQDESQPEAQDDIEKSLEEMRNRVDKMTQRMEENLRKMIDDQHHMQSVKESIAASATDARAKATTQATQPDRTQEYEDFTPTDPAGRTQATQNQPTTIEVYRSKLEDAQTRYQSYSMEERYAENNTYHDFMRVVHDAKNPEGNVDLPHQSEWFKEGAVAAPGVTSRTQGQGNEDEDEEGDITISRAAVSTKCPLTLQEFKHPFTSTKCPHSFEKTAILSLIRRSVDRAVQCPVSGCAQILSEGDLHSDAVLIRQIKRLQRAQELQREEADDQAEEGGEGPTVIEDEDDEEGGAADDVDTIIETRNTQFKSEPRASGARSSAGGNDTSAMDVDGEDEDEEETDDEEMEE